MPNLEQLLLHLEREVSIAAVPLGGSSSDGDGRSRPAAVALDVCRHGRTGQA